MSKILSTYRNLLFILFPFVLISCADRKDSAQSCAVKLDEQRFSNVSENENCSNYERASGYLGRAGMSFSNYLKPGAVDNLTKTLGISKLNSPDNYTAGNREYVTKALCLIGADAFVTSSRCGNGSSRARSSDEVEISISANIADFIYLGYGALDNDSNGLLTESELTGFTKLQTSGISTDGLGTGLSTYNNNFEVLIGDNHFIANSNLSSCDEYSNKYTDNASSGTSCAQRALTLNQSISEVRPIFKLDNMTDVTTGGTLNTLVKMVNELSTISNALSSDFDTIGINSENRFRKILTESLNKFDNGAKDNNPNVGDNCTSVKLFDVMYYLVQNAGDNSTTPSELKSVNLVNTSDLLGAVDSSLSLYPSGATDFLKEQPMSTARIVFATNSPGTIYTDSYEKAESSLYQAIKNTRSLGTEESVKGDGKVTFRELICIPEN